jgi:hypothetical protein
MKIEFYVKCINITCDNNLIMAIPQRIYNLGKEIATCDLVKTGTPSQENMVAFQNLLNQSWPVDDSEIAQRDLVRGMYYSNPFGFMRYLSVPEHRVRSLVLWTESKCIAKLFNLSGKVHIGWNEASSAYTVVPYIPRENRVTSDNKSFRRKAPRNDRKNKRQDTPDQPQVTILQNPNRTQVTNTYAAAASRTQPERDLADLPVHNPDPSPTTGKKLNWADME